LHKRNESSVTERTYIFIILPQERCLPEKTVSIQIGRVYSEEMSLIVYSSFFRRPDAWRPWKEKGSHWMLLLIRKEMTTLYVPLSALAFLLSIALGWRWHLGWLTRASTRADNVGIYLCGITLYNVNSQLYQLLSALSFAYYAGDDQLIRQKMSVALINSAKMLSDPRQRGGTVYRNWQVGIIAIDFCFWQPTLLPYE